MVIPDHLTCIQRNLYAGQEAVVRTRHEKTNWFTIEKGVHQGCILSPCLLNLYAEYIMWNARLDEAQAGIKIVGRNINNLRYSDDATLMVESDEELEPLDESERRDWKSWLKTQHSEIEDHGIWSHHFVAKRWETMETVTDYFGGAPKSLQMVTAAMKLKDDCSLGKKLWQT